jgi:hypothetical protein
MERQKITMPNTVVITTGWNVPNQYIVQLITLLVPEV